MKMVIDIDEKAYEVCRLTKNLPCDEGILFRRMRDAIGNGTPLPVHHGRLVDADKVESMLKNHAKSESEAWALVELLNVLDEIPTVLKATKEGDGE